MDSDPLLVVVVVTALGFGFSNGVLDAPTLLSSLVSTRAIRPKVAMLGVGALNFAGAFLTLAVAVTLSEKIIDPSAVTGSVGVEVVFAGLVGALTWTLVTGRLGLAPSSSHSLIGGLVGATVAGVGFGGIELGGLVGLAFLPAVLAPLAAFLLAAVLINLIYRGIAGRRPGPVGRFFRSAQHLSGGAVALAHGSNDAQKTMGVITLALLANGTLDEGSGTPFWVVLAGASAIALGTLVGSRKSLSRPVPRVMKIDPAQGFVSQAASSATILAASFLGFPLSTTQVINGGTVGSGVNRTLSVQRWGLARAVTRAWLLTFPVTALIGAGAFGISTLFGGGLVGGIAAAVLIPPAAAFVVARYRPGTIRR